MTDLESPRKNNDCYFYYYSTCTKGDNCTFRHEPSALGCETTCSFWKEGKCINVHCNFRHMELRKNRKSIPCYWESQPGGCKKPHCPFLHTSPKSAADNGETSDLKSTDGKESDICNKKSNDVENNFGSPVVDPLVVNFEEESDNESAPTQSPIKTQRVVKVKTLEEIKLERIQAESAAYYSYPEPEIIFQKEADEAEFLRKRIIRRMGTKPVESNIDIGSIEILSLEEIRKRKRKDVDNDAKPVEKSIMNSKKQKISLMTRKTSNDINDIKVKTLEEIKAERAKRFGMQSKRKLKLELVDPNELSPSDNKKFKTKEIDVATSEAEVSSTSKTDTHTEDISKMQCIVSPVQRLQDRDINSEDESVNSKSNDNVVSGSTQEPCDKGRSKTKLESSKLDDLLLDEEDYETLITLKTEEDILKDIDNLLNE